MLKKILFWIFFVSLFFVTSITVILHIYEDEINQYAIDELNNYLKTNIEVKQMEVSIFHEFPNASIGFENIFIADAFETFESDDTLLFAEHLYLDFNLWDVFSGDYKVKRVSINDGQINLRTTAKGDVNYAIIKESEDSVETDDNFKFLIELLKVKRVDFALYNQSTKQDYKIKIKDARITGDFAATEYQLKADGDLYVNRIKSNSLTLISDKSAHLIVGLDINTEKQSYQFNRGDLLLDDMSFKINGAIDSAEIDLDITGQNIQVAQVVESILPEETGKEKQYKGDGIVNFIAKIKGPLMRTEMPSITADFSLVNAALTETESKLKVNDINIIGNYCNAYEGRIEKVDLKMFRLKLLNSHLKGSAEITDFAQPLLSTTANGDLDLAAFHRFFGFQGVEELGGNVQLNLTTSIRFFDPEYRKDKFQILSSNGILNLNQVYYKATGSPMRFKSVSGEMVIKEKDAAIKDFVLKIQKSDLRFNGAIQNLIGYIEGSGNLAMVATMESDNFDLNEFLGPSNKEREGPLTQFELPSDINLNLELRVKNFDWDKHNFKDITAQFLLANRTVTVNQLSMKTLGGEVTGRLMLENRLANGNSVDGTIKFSAINVKNLFAEWDNFQQTSITDQHLSGTVNGEIDFLLLFNPYFSIVEEQIFALSSIRIINGELNNLETMKAVTDYMRSNKALKLMLNKHIDRFEDKLMHLKFSELQNQIEIKDRRINIPKMTIKSNALDVELFGWHDFDNRIEYHFSFRFNQLKEKPEYTEFGKVADDGLGIIIYMTMSGTIDEPIFTMDKEERKNDLKESITLEKQNMKSMLKTEFGLFQKDSTVKQMNVDNKKEVEFIFYDTDLEEEQNDTTKKKTKNKTRSSTFFDKLKEEAEKNKQDIQYEDDL